MSATVRSALPALLAAAGIGIGSAFLLAGMVETQDAGTTANTAAAAAASSVPAEWRDARRPELRAVWDDLEGEPAPAIRPLSGWMNTEARSWEDLEGKVVLIDAWATWCGPCKAAIPKLVKMHEAHHEDGLVILGVHSSRGAGAMHDFVTENELPYAFAADTEGTLLRELGVRYIPSYFVVDRRGTMRVAGADPRHLEDIVTTLLDESPEASKQALATGWPEHVEKTLYADDFRGKKAPEFVVEQWLTDQPETEDKVVLIDFWATWCPPCREAIPELNEIQERFDDDLVVIGVSDESPETVRAFMDGTEMDYPQAIDREKRMSKTLGVKGIPHVIIVDRDGIVRWQGYPLDEADRLTPKVVERIIATDRARRAPEKTDSPGG